MTTVAETHIYRKNEYQRANVDLFMEIQDRWSGAFEFWFPNWSKAPWHVQAAPKGADQSDLYTVNFWPHKLKAMREGGGHVTTDFHEIDRIMGEVMDDFTQDTEDDPLLDAGDDF